MDAVMRAMAFNYVHRKKRKREFRNLWVIRLGVASKINGVPYNKLICGLKKSQCELNRKMLSELAIFDPQAFASVVETAKKAL